MTEYPITPGYTINIVKDKTQPAVLLLNPAPSGRGVKQFYITVPETQKDSDHNARHVEYGKSKLSSQDIFYFIEDNSEQVISSEVVVEEDGTYVNEAEQNCEPIMVATGQDSSSIVYYQDNQHEEGSGMFFTEVAHEETVTEEVIIDNEEPVSRKSPSVITSVQCDLCNSNLDSTEEAKNHMRHVHNILTYEGPFFKCDFCGIYVTDRVSHMKVAHYSPLAQAFCKTNNSYQCLQCSYTSDQLTNIRNHVDAKHGSGKNKYVCEECNSEYKTLNSMRAHKSRVHVKKRRLVALNQSQHNRDPITISRNHKLQKEILELEEKTLPKFLKTCSIDL